MLNWLRHSVTVQVAPRLGFAIYLYYYVPLVSWLAAELEWKILGCATALTAVSIALDWRRYVAWRSEQQSARFWAERRRRRESASRWTEDPP